MRAERATSASPKSPGGALLDDTARALIEMLQRDGRQSYASMALAVGLSEAAVRQRVQRLIDAQVLQIVAVTDPTQVGFARIHPRFLSPSPSTLWMGSISIVLDGGLTLV
jgi:DNA-binding Lrp family transcriptional regulator